MGKRILCIEDSDETLALLELVLRNYSLKFSKSLADASQTLSKNDFDLILLDVELPDGSGLDLMSKLYSCKSQIPVMFLTAKSDLVSKAAAFSLGAEDFIVKPFDPVELKLRVDARLRKKDIAEQENRVIRAGDLICHLDQNTIENWSTGQVASMTSLEFKILTLLLRTPNKIFSRDEILDSAWGPAVTVSERAVDVHISNLRKKLIGLGATIVSVIGSGYRLVYLKGP